MDFRRFSMGRTVWHMWSMVLVSAFMYSLAASDARASDNAGILTPKDVARMAYVGWAAISQDGSHAAWMKHIPRDPYEKPAKHDPEFEDGSPRNELWVMRLPDGEPMLFVGQHSAIGGVQWLPDGTGLSFLAKRPPDKNRSLYVISLTGGEARRALAHETDIGSYTWHPDGSRVAFLSTEKEPKAREDLKKKGFKAEVYEESPRFARLWIAAIGENAGEPEQVKLDGHVVAPKWSPDGGRIVAKVSPTPLTDDLYMKQQAWIIDAASREVTLRIEHAAKLGDVEWSTDGRRLAINCGEDIHDPSEGRLMIASASEGKSMDVLPNFEGHVKSMAWQNADTLMYVADVGTTTIFGKVNADGTDQKTIVPAAIGEPILGGVSLSKDGTVGVFVASARHHPPEMYVMKHGDSKPRRLTDSNPWLAGMRLARQETITYKARDGLEIQGILIHPLDAEPGKRYPLIVYVHGGPEAHESDGWLTNYSRPGQVAASAGFVVFNPNYRGSTGRGVAFSKLGQADYAGAEFDDLVDAMRHLVNMGLVDETKVGVTGGSYGGYASAWCATKLSEHFAAAVMFVGISDLVSKFGTTDIPNEMFLSHARKWPWEGNWDWFRDRSPVHHVAQGRTPLLILHGKEDTRVHPSQSMEMYRYLKTIGRAPVRLVFYPGEGHGNAKAAARLDYNLRMMQWFEHYLIGPGGDPPGDEIDYDLPKKETKTPPPDGDGASEKS